MLRASPWDALLNLREPISLQDFKELQLGKPWAEADTKLSVLLRELGAGDRTTLSLSIACDLTSNQVWGLLKGPRADRQVTFENGRWSLVPNYPGRDVIKAAKLLRSKGWIVEPPEAMNAQRVELDKSLQALKPGSEVIQWRDLESMPDADAVVLIELLGDGEPTWLGTWDGENWRYIDSSIVTSTVTGWAVIPEGRPRR